MQITARLVVFAETTGLSPAEIYEKTTIDPDDGGFTDIPEAEEVWQSDSMILHSAFSEDLDGMDAPSMFLKRLVSAINDVDDLALRELPEAEGTIAGSLSPATVSLLLAAYRQERGASRKALEGCEPSDEEIASSDYVDYLEQWTKTLEIAERRRAAIIISAC